MCAIGTNNRDIGYRQKRLSNRKEGKIMNEEYIEENYFGADECVDGMECVVGGGLE